MESRLLLAAVSWDGGGDGVSWTNALNWSNDALPTANDDVTIDIAGSPVITLGSGAQAVKSLVSHESLSFNGGSLAVSQTATLHAPLTLNGGSLIGGAWQGSADISVAANSAISGVQLDTDLIVTSYKTLTITNGLVLNGAISLSYAASYDAKLDFSGTQTLSGSGTILLSRSYHKLRSVGTSQNPATLTVGPGITIKGYGYVQASYGNIVNQGLIQADAASNTLYLQAPLVNEGTLKSTAGTLSVTSTSGWTNNGAVVVAGGTLTLANPWSGSGNTFNVSGGTLNLGGTFSTASLGTWSRSGGTVRVIGTLDNTNATHTLDATTGSWVLDGGTLKGGTFTASGGQSWLGGTTSSSFSGTLDGARLDADLTINNYGTLTITNGLVLNGNVGLSYAASYDAKLDFSGTQTLSGSGSVLLSRSYHKLRSKGTSQNPATLTVGPDITIKGYGYIQASYGNIVNQGLIQAEVASNTLYLQAPLVNEGTLKSTAGTLSVTSASGWTHNGAVVVAGGTVSLSNSWSGIGSTFNVSSGTLNLGGTWSVSQPTFTLSGGSTVLGGAWSSTAGSFNISAGALRLDGQFATASLGAWTRSGGTVQIAGDLDNSNAVLNLAGPVELDGAAITGGTIAGDLVAVLSNSTFDGVTLQADLEILSGATLNVLNGLALESTLTVGPGASNFATLLFSGTQTLSGEGEIALAHQTAARLRVQGAAGTPATLTIDADITIRGIGSITQSDGSIVNQAKIHADVPGGWITINTPMLNSGILQIDGDAVIDLNGQELHSEVEALSGNEVRLLTTGGMVDVSYKASTSGRSNVSVPGGRNGSLHVVRDLPRNQVVAIHAIGTHSLGGQLIFSHEVTMPDEADEFGLYRVGGVARSDGSPANEFSYDQNWQVASSPEGALSLALGEVSIDGIACTDIPRPTADGRYILVYAHLVAVGGSIGDVLMWYPDYYETYVAKPFFGWVSVHDTFTFDIKEIQALLDAGGSALTDDDPNATGGNPMDLAYSEDPIRYFDGAVQYESQDLESSGLGDPFGVTRSWTNRSHLATNDNAGNGVIISELPSLKIHSGGAVTIIASGTDARRFEKVGANYVPQSLLPDTLTHDAVAKEFVLTDSSGNQIRFFDHDSTWPPAKRGQFKSKTSPAGILTYVASWTATGQIAEIRRQDAGQVDQESWLYSHLGAGDANAGKIANAQLRRPDGNGGWTIVRQVSYTYYGSQEPHGVRGDLKTVEIQDAQGNNLDTKYYRYYEWGEEGGYGGGLKAIFDAESFARLAEAFADPFAASDQAVAPFASQRFVYDSQRRVVEHHVRGLGSSQNNGIGVFTYSYHTSQNQEAVNVWKYKTIETLPDGNQNVIYCNALGEVMLKVFRNIGDAANPALQGLEWATFHRYDEAGRLIWTAEPSAVLGYDEDEPDLLQQVNGNYLYLADDTGLIRVNQYYASTTATPTTAGGAAGYLQGQHIQHGELGSPIAIESQTYYSRSAGGATIYPQATLTTYPDSSGSGPLTTEYSYSWYAGTTQMQSLAISYPAVAGGQNGSGVAAVERHYFDSFGRAIWQQDGDGHVHFTSHDNGTGAVVKTVTDVDYDQLTAAEQSLFDATGWTQTDGLHLATVNEVDGLGRVTATTDPNGHITYIVHRDLDHEVRTYRGWDGQTLRPTGPTLVVRQDRAGGYTEVLTMSAAPDVAAGLPTGGESIGDIQSLRRSYSNAGGQIVAVDEYASVAGLTYSADADWGDEGTHYQRVQYAYDDRGRQYRTINPVGTLTDTLYDSLGRIASVYVGTSEQNRVIVRSYTYDHNDVGDGHNTEVIEYPSAAAQDQRLTLNLFDWRGRLVSSKTGAQANEDDVTNRPLQVFGYDNLDRLVSEQLYDADQLAMTDANDDGLPDGLSASALRASTTYHHDNLGRVYEVVTQQRHGSSGAVLGDDLVTGHWYDARGHLIKSQAPDGAVSKFAYDGAGRLILLAISDGGGDSAYSDAANLTGDLVWQQTEYQFDANGNMTMQTTRHRFGDESASATGPLGDFTASPQARVVYSAHYYDAANRRVAEVDAGTYGGAAYSRPANVPASTDQLHVTSYVYDDAGLLQRVTDPVGVQTRMFYDAMGRMTRRVDAYVDGLPSAADDRTTDYTYNGLGFVLTQTLRLAGDGPDQVTRFVYGIDDELASNDLLARVEFPDPQTGLPSSSSAESYAYNRLGQRVQAVTLSGAVVQSQFDVVGRTQSQTTQTSDGSGQPQESWQYDAAGRVIQHVNPRGAVTASEYDSLGRRIRLTQADPDGAGPLAAPVSQYEYDEAGRLIGSLDARGHLTSYGYDALGRLVSTTDPDPDGAGPQVAPITTYGYYLGGDRHSVTDPRGNLSGATAADFTTQQVLDRFGRVVQVIKPSPDGTAPAPTSSITFDRLGRALASTDALGNTTGYAYDLLGRLVEVTQADPDGAGPATAPITSSSYDAAGNLLTRTDALGQTTEYTYDAWNRRVSMWRPSPDGVASRPVTEYTYDDAGNLIGQTDPLGHQTSFLYNQRGLMVQRTEADPDGAGSQSAPQTLYEYDLAGNLVQVTDALGQATQYLYDLLNRRTAQIDPSPGGNIGGAMTQYAYDAAGNLVAVIDPLNQATTYEYDGLNRQTARTLPDPDGVGPLDAPLTTFTYDVVGNLLSRTDPVGNTTQYSYDRLSRLVQETNESGDPRSYEYDPAGNLLRRIDRTGRVRQFAYDNLGRQTAEVWRDSVQGPVVHAIEFAYDAAGRMTSAEDGEFSYVYDYDHLGRLISLDNAGTVSAPDVVLEYAYDAAGNLTSLAAGIDSNADFTNAYSYDALNRLVQLTQSGASVDAKRVDFTWSALGEMESLTRYADLAGALEVASTAWSYDNAGRLIGLAHDSGLNTIAAYTFTFDAPGRIVGFNSPDDDIDYTYDALGQLLVADLTAGTDEQYSYDEAGNRTLSGYSTGLDNRLLSDGVYDYVYDDEGNLLSRTDTVSDEVAEYQWDHRNRLTHVTFKDDQGVVTRRVRYRYDHSNLRIATETDGDADGIYESAERFVLDRGHIALVFDQSGTLTQRYLHGPDTDQVLAQEDASTSSTAWLLGDHENSVRDVIDDSAAAVDHIVYDSFGRIVSRSSSTFDLRFAYSGRELAGEAGFSGDAIYYHRQRFYDAGVGRFLSEDPLGFGGGDDNLYRYVGNDPLNHVDPTGLYAEDDVDLSQLSDRELVEWALNKAAQINLVTGEYTLEDVSRYADYLRSRGVSGSAIADAMDPYVDALSDAINQRHEAVRYETGTLTAVEKFDGSMSILSNSVTWGGSDAVGLTNSQRYRSEVFVGARLGAAVAREALVGAASLGVSGAVQAGRGGLWLQGASAGLRLREAYETGSSLGHAAYDLQQGRWASAAGNFAVAGLGGYSALGRNIRFGPSLEQQRAREIQRYLGQGHTPAQAGYLAQPYTGLGHHFAGRRLKLPQAISNSRFNVLKPGGISRGAFYEKHFYVDPHFYGARFPKSIGGSWSGQRIGLTKAGPVGRLWHGSPAPLKAAAAGTAGAGGVVAWRVTAEDR